MVRILSTGTTGCRPSYDCGLSTEIAIEIPENNRQRIDFFRFGIETDQRPTRDRPETKSSDSITDQTTTRTDQTTGTRTGTCTSSILVMYCSAVGCSLPRARRTGAERSRRCCCYRSGTKMPTPGVEPLPLHPRGPRFCALDVASLKRRCVQRGESWVFIPGYSDRRLAGLQPCKPHSQRQIATAETSGGGDERWRDKCMTLVRTCTGSNANCRAISIDTESDADVY